MKVKVWDSIWSDYFNQISQSEFGMRALTNRRLGMRKCVRCRVMNIRTLFLATGSGLIFRRGEESQHQSHNFHCQGLRSNLHTQTDAADSTAARGSEWWSAVFIVFLSPLTTEIIMLVLDQICRWCVVWWVFCEPSFSFAHCEKPRRLLHLIQ